MTMLKDYVAWWWRRDSKTACLITIDLAQTMTTQDLINTADYFYGLAALKKANDDE